MSTGSDGGLGPCPQLHALLVPRVPDLARRAVEQITVEVPLYRLLPREVLEADVFDVTLHNVRLFARMLADGRLPTRDQFAAVGASAGRRAEERVPLADLLAAYHIGARMGWLELVALAQPARPDHADELAMAGVHLWRYTQEVTGVVSAAYIAVEQTIHDEERIARQELASALLERGDRATGSLAVRADLTVAPAHVVVALAVAPGQSDSRAGVTAAIAARRRVRLLQQELDELAGEPVLGKLDGSGGLVLLPATPDSMTAIDSAVDRLVEVLAKATGEPVHAATSPAATAADIPGAARLAGDLVDLARRLQRPPGAYRLEDLLVEYQLTRPGPAADALARQLDQLEGQPQLMETLRTYLAHGRQRRRSAESLHVHPNTLGYRLGRIAALTGLDPTSHADSQLLAAALTVRDGQVAGSARVNR